MKRATILMYHILDRTTSQLEAKYCCPPDRFAEHMAWLRDSCHPVGLDMLVSGLDERTGPAENSVAITFDDGFSSTYEYAMPVLERYAIPATMYIVCGRIGGDNDWMHSREKPRRTLMDAGQIREMQAAGIAIGSHTLTHPRLPDCSPEQMSREIFESKARLEELLSRSVSHFAYPYGQYTMLAREMVQQAGYTDACSTRSGFNNGATHRFELRRIEVFGSDRVWHLKRKLKFGTNDAAWDLPAKYYFGRAISRFRSWS